MDDKPVRSKDYEQGRQDAFAECIEAVRKFIGATKSNDFYEGSKRILASLKSRALGNGVGFAHSEYLRGQREALNGAPPPHRDFPEVEPLDLVYKTRPTKEEHSLRMLLISKDPVGSLLYEAAYGSTRDAIAYQIVQLWATGMATKAEVTSMALKAYMETLGDVRAKFLERIMWDVSPIFIPFDEKSRVK